MNKLEEKIKDLKNNGIPSRKIALELKISTHTVSKYTGNGNSNLKEKIILLRSQNKSIKQIAKELKCSKSTASKWSSKIENNHNITNTLNELRINNNSKKSNRSHNLKTQESNNDLYGTLKRNNRSERRKFLLEISGNKCCKCGYDKCKSALQFHHLDPLIKDFRISGVKVERSIDLLLKEISKCVLLCANCHIELHSSPSDFNKLTPINIDKVIIPDHIKTFKTNTLDEANTENEIKWINNQKSKILNIKSITEESNFDLNLIKIKRITTPTLNAILYQFHYLGPSKKGGLSLGFFDDNDQLIGGSLITNPSRKISLNNVCEISRFVLTKKQHNLASKCLSLTINYIKQNSQYERVQSFSNDELHLGTIYKACNFRELGKTGKTYTYDGINKNTIYRRSMAYGLTEHEYAEKFNLNKITESTKTKYIMNLRSNL